MARVVASVPIRATFGRCNERVGEERGEERANTVTDRVMSTSRHHNKKKKYYRYAKIYTFRKMKLNKKEEKGIQKEEEKGGPMDV